MIWLILGFLLTNGPWLLFFALFEYKPGWVQHEGPSLLLFYIGTVARIQSGGSSAHYAPHIAAQQLCAGCAPLWPDVVAEDLWQKCAYSKITVTPLPQPPTFALSAAIQMWTGKNIPEYFAKEEKMLEDEMQRRSVAVWAAG